MYWDVSILMTSVFSTCCPAPVIRRPSFQFCVFIVNVYFHWVMIKAGFSPLIDCSSFKKIAFLFPQVISCNLNAFPFQFCEISLYHNIWKSHVVKNFLTFQSLFTIHVSVICFLLLFFFFGWQFQTAHEAG